MHCLLDVNRGKTGRPAGNTWVASCDTAVGHGRTGLRLENTEIGGVTMKKVPDPDSVGL